MRFLILTLIPLVLAACSTPKKVTIRAPAPPRLAEMGTAYFTEIKFPTKKAFLTFSEQRRIGDVVDMAKIEAAPDRVIVIAWSDQEVPTRTKDQIQLAHDRASIVKKLIQEKHADLNIETISMVTQPGRLAELFETPETRKALALAGLQPDSTEAEHPKASKTIVVVIPKKK